MSLNEMKERIALRFLRDENIDEVVTNGDEVLVRKYACNDFIRVGRPVDVYNQMLERDEAATR